MGMGGEGGGGAVKEQVSYAMCQHCLRIHVTTERAPQPVISGHSICHSESRSQQCH